MRRKPLLYSLRNSSNGLTYIDYEDMSLAVIIPSRQRTDVLQDCPALGFSNVFVHESEEHDYAQSFLLPAARRPLTLQTHDIVNNFTALSNHMLDKAWSDPACTCVVRSTDRIIHFLSMMTRSSYTKVAKPDLFMGIIWQAARMAQDAGLSLFGWNRSIGPHARTCQQPFKLRGWMMGGVIGLCDRSMRIPDGSGPIDDLALSLEAQTKDGIFICDQRYAVVSNDKVKHGGIKGLRNYENHYNSLKYLERRYSPEVIKINHKELKDGLRAFSVKVEN